jgi:ribosomal protein S18 acetylase RimI-like enzyme
VAERSYRINEAGSASLGDGEIIELLYRAYVDGGFTDPAVALSAFDPAAVLARGNLLFVRGSETGALAGMVIVVPPTSPARRLAGEAEAELHLLAVRPEQRGAGIGQALVEAALQLVWRMGHRRMLLWTQPEMRAAQRLYERCGFAREPQLDFERDGRRFRVYAIDTHNS